jgi:transcriptional regulator with XRE-family HTH domain
MAQKVIPHPKPEKAKHFIRAWRKYRRLTQEQLAERIEMTSGAISQLENGIINYTQPTLEAIAYALNCEPGDLLSRDPRTDDAVHDLRSILAKASATDQQKALRIIREMLGTGTDG